MIKLSKTESTRFNKIKNLLVKILGFGKKDIVECIEGQPFGVDSRPIKGEIAIIARTTGQEDIVLGYLPKNRLSDVGETRIFSVDSNGDLKAFAWFKKDGKIQFNGTGDHLVGYNALKLAFDELKNNFNEFVTAYDSHTHISGSSGSPTGVPDRLGGGTTADISGSKKENLQTV